MRQKRVLREGASYHVVARANRQEFILNSDVVKHLFLQTILRAKKRYRFQVITLCLMSNHVHLMMRPARDESLSRIMQWILSVFAIRFNVRLGIRGHVWYDRFRSKVIASLRQFVRTMAYIGNNPVRAGIVTRAEDYRFGGFRLARDGPPGLVDGPAVDLRLLSPAGRRSPMTR